MQTNESQIDFSSCDKCAGYDCECEEKELVDEPKINWVEIQDS